MCMVWMIDSQDNLMQWFCVTNGGSMCVKRLAMPGGKSYKTP